MARQNENRKILVTVIVGTRPEAIKMAPIVHELRERPDAFSVTLVNTAQHREMVDQVFSVYGIKADVDLDLMEENQSLATILAKGAWALDAVFSTNKADIVLVEGDTSTVFVASLIAFYHRIDVGHVEAGLRSHDRYRPFPEEINRKITSVVASIHFAPTEWARGNLLREGYPAEAIFVTGNPVVDSLLKALGGHHEFQRPLNEIDYDASRMILVTAHRRENHGKPLANICEAILEIAERNDDVIFVYPVHPNPNVRTVVTELLGNRDRIYLVDPVEYVSFVYLMKAAYLILTDSGGMQEEAPTLKTPVLVLREKTERPEAVEAGTARVVGTDRARIVDEVCRLLKNREEYEAMVTEENPFGDGMSAQRIADILQGRYS
jgi:UDP-N-acetylglucosamine 2-epimerase (non-hydrolysing)